MLKIAVLLTSNVEGDWIDYHSVVKNDGSKDDLLNNLIEKFKGDEYHYEKWYKKYVDAPTFRGYEIIQDNDKEYYFGYWEFSERDQRKYFNRIFVVVYEEI